MIGMVLRGAFVQVGIGLAIGIPAAIGAGYLIAEPALRGDAVGSVDAGYCNGAAGGCGGSGSHCSGVPGGESGSGGGAEGRVTRASLRNFLIATRESQHRASVDLEVGKRILLTEQVRQRKLPHCR